jgi:hypothetical protein
MVKRGRPFLFRNGRFLSKTSKYLSRMGQNEVQNQEPGTDQFVGKAAAIAQVLAVESAIDLA